MTAQRRRRPGRRVWRPRREGGLGVVLSAALGEAASVADALAALATVAADVEVPVEVLLSPWGQGNLEVFRAVADDAGLPVRLLPVCESGNAARNSAVAHVAAEHLLFVDPLTRMRSGSLQTLLAATAGDRFYRVVRAVGDRSPFNPASYLFRAGYLRDSVLTFDEAHGDLPDATCARALSVRPIEIEAQLWDPVRRSGAARGSVPAWSDRIEDWLAMVPAVRQMVHGPDKTHWLHELIVADLPGLLADAERLPYALLPQLADVVGALIAALPAPDLARVPVEARATAWLGGQARWGDLAELLARRATQEGQFPTRVEGTRIYAELPGVDWEALHAPEPMLEVGLEESRLQASVRRVRWSGATGDVLAVDVFALIRHLGLAGPGILARWVPENPLRDGVRIEPVRAEVRRRADPGVAVASGLRYQEQSQGSVTVTTPVADLLPGSWHLELAVTQGRVVRTGRVRARDLTGSAGALRPSPDGAVQPGWDDGGLRLDVAAPGAHAQPRNAPPRVVAARTEDGWLALDVSGRLGSKPALVSPEAAIVGFVDHQTVRFELRTQRFGLPEHAAPCGRYRLLLEGRELAWDASAEDETGFDLAGAEHRICVRRTPRGGVLVDLRPPLRDDEVGPSGQSRLLTAYDVQRPLSEVVLLESVAGRACTGSPFAIDRELALAHPELARTWAVEDLSVVVPEGAERVLRHGREWHQLLATAHLVVTDGELPAFFSRRTGQLVLQTLSGYPARTMGVDEWNERNLAPRRIEHLLARSGQQWSALVAPSARVEHWFRESFRYDGEVLSLGLPRTDLLLADDADEHGRLTRRRLEIDDDQTVLFYAPEPGAHPVYGVRPREIVDVGELASALGSRCTVLLRDPAPGRRPVGSTGARVVDVSAHPEVADLMLASDVALFDYSALRFDYALLQRPMIFQVPDPSVRRGDTRGFLFPYSETAPGPMAATVDDVVDLLDDLPRVQREQAAALARFNAEFNDMADGHASARVVAELFGRRFGSRLGQVSRTRPDDRADVGPDRAEEPADGSEVHASYRVAR